MKPLYTFVTFFSLAYFILLGSVCGHDSPTLTKSPEQAVKLILRKLEINRGPLRGIDSKLDGMEPMESLWFLIEQLKTDLGENYAGTIIERAIVEYAHHEEHLGISPTRLRSFLDDHYSEFEDAFTSSELSSYERDFYRRMLLPSLGAIGAKGLEEDHAVYDRFSKIDDEETTGYVEDAREYLKSQIEAKKSESSGVSELAQNNNSPDALQESDQATKSKPEKLIIWIVGLLALIGLIAFAKRTAQKRN